MLQKLSGEADGGSGLMGGAGTIGESAMAAENLSDDVITRMINEFETLGQKEDFNGALDSMMRQLLAKDIMYIPCKQLCDAFPAWLAKNKAGMTKDEYEK